jgi:hypothetical protein
VDMRFSRAVYAHHFLDFVLPTVALEANFFFSEGYVYSSN